MAKKEKHIIVKKWEVLKALSKSESPSLDEVEELSSDLIAHLAQLSLNGVEEVDGKSIDLFKDRAWWTLEKHGLLPEYNEEEEEQLVEVFDEWETIEETEEFEDIDEDSIYDQIGDM